MESIKLALLSLKKGTSESKNKANSDVASAMVKLSAIMTYLKQDTLSDSAFSKLSNLLRHTTQPLYKHDLDLTLNFASAVFLGLHTAKVLTSKDPSSRMVWEMAQSSVLSGLLDHLDDHRTAKTKGPIGQAFFSSLCKLYIPASPDGRISTHSDLLTTVFMLLSELVSGQAGNAANFRKELNGVRRLGYAILNIRDFLPLEAVLELFANLLFAFKGANAKADRTKFIQEAFDPGLFHSSQLIATLSKVTSPSIWSRASSDVMKVIACLNISFPQPFDVSNFQLKGIQTKSIYGLYLESDAFVLSIPSDEGDDTLIIPLRHVTELNIASSDLDVSVSLILNEPPLIGKKPLETKEKTITCQWTVQKDDVTRFLNSLKHRKVSFNALNLDIRRKLSIAETGITLDLNSDAGPPKPTQEKAVAIAKLWDGAEREGADYGATSPLMHSIFPPNSEEINAIQLLDPPSVFIDGEGNFTKNPTQPVPKPLGSSLVKADKADAVKPKASNDVLIKRSLSILMSASKHAQEEADDVQPKAHRRRNNNIILSDDGSELTDPDQYDVPSPTPTRRSPRLSRGPALPKMSEGKIAPPPASVGKKKVAQYAPPVTETKPRVTARTCRSSTRNKENESPAKPVIDCPPGPINRTDTLSLSEPTPPTRASKRGASPALILSDDDEPPLPPAKKLRPSPEPRSRLTTRYKSTMKGSTPAVINLADDDDDYEPPKANPRTATKKQSVEPKRTGRKAAMKDRSGKPKPRPVPTTKRTTRANANVNAQEARGVAMEEVKPALSFMKVEPERKPASITMTEANPIDLGTTAPYPKVEEMNPTKSSSRKPQKAVWQRDSFMANLELQKQSTPPKDLAQGDESDPISVDHGQVPEGAFRFDSEPLLPMVEAERVEDSIRSDDVNGGSDTFVAEPPVVEYDVPIKAEPEASPPPQENILVKDEAEDVVMIDLISPEQSRRASPIPVPAPVPPPVKHREVAPDHVEPNPKVKKAVPPPAPCRQEIATRINLAKSEVKDKAGGVSAVARKKVQKVEIIQRRREVGKIELKQGRQEVEPVRRCQEAHAYIEQEECEVNGGRPRDMKVVASTVAGTTERVKASIISQPALVDEQATDDEEPVLPKRPAPQPIDKSVRQFGALESAHLQVHQSIKNEKKSHDHRLKLPHVQTNRYYEQKGPAYPKKHFINKVPDSRDPVVKGIANAPKEVRVKEPLSDVSDVLRDIQEALAERLNNRFEETKQDISQSQLFILHQAAEDLRPMSREGAEHFNALVDLEAEYGTHRRKIMNGIDTFRESMSQASGDIKQIIQSHNRHSLVKKFPAKLFSQPPPKVQLNVV